MANWSERLGLNLDPQMGLALHHFISGLAYNMQFVGYVVSHPQSAQAMVWITQVVVASTYLDWIPSDNIYLSDLKPNRWWMLGGPITTLNEI